MDGAGTPFAALAAFVMSYGLLVMLPGPNMAVAVRAGLTMSRTDQTKTVFGIALGASVLVTVTTLPTVVFPLDGSGRVIPIVAGLILVGLGLRMLLMSGTTPDRTIPGKTGSGFGIAFITACSNPTTALYFASSGLSAAGLPPAFRMISMATVVFTVAAIWFSLVSWMLSNEPFRLRSLRYRRVIDNGAALLLMGFGVFTMLGTG